MLLTYTCLCSKLPPYSHYHPPTIGGNTGGISSSLVFTPVQGIELVNPNADAEAKVNHGLGELGLGFSSVFFSYILMIVPTLY